MLKFYKIYGLYGLIRLFRDKLFTYLYYPNARIIRLPFYIRGKKGIRGAKSLTTGVNLRIDIISRKNFTPTLQIGDNVQFNDYVHIAVAKGVFIGDNTLIAQKFLFPTTITEIMLTKISQTRILLQLRESCFLKKYILEIMFG